MKWNPAQQDAIDARDGDLCVVAAAGSGKTTVLIERILRLLERDRVDLSRIVAITFTDAAAAEMRERLRTSFRGREADADRDALTFWRDLSRRVETARISTIHTFCGGLLRENAPAIGLDPDFTVLADTEAALLRDEILRACLYELLEQEDASALYCIGELGAARVLQLCETLLDKREILATIEADAEPAADEDELMARWQRIAETWRREILTAPDVRKQAQTYAGQLRAYEGRMIGERDGREDLRPMMIAELDTIVSSDSTPTIVAALGRLANTKVPGNTRARNWEAGAHASVKEAQDAIRAWAQGLPCEDVSDEGVFPSAKLSFHLHQLARRMTKAYQDAKRARNVVDFSDMIDLALRMLHDNVDLRGRVAHSIDHLLVDEFQDTDPLQYKMVRILKQANPNLQLFLVGDAKQSIYGFRGADVTLFQDAARECREIRLDRNYRSAPEVIDFVNAVCAEAPLLGAVEASYAPMQAHRDLAGQCRVEALVAEVPDDPKAKREQLQEREAELIARRIAEICGKHGEGRPFSDVAILFRSTRAMYLYERALRDVGVPYQVVAGEGYYDRQEVIDVVNLLRVVLDPLDESALIGLLRSPACGLSDEALAAMAHAGGIAQTFAGSEIPDGLREAAALEAARALVADLRARRHAPLAEFIRYAIDRSNLEAIALTLHLGLQRASNIRKIAELADDFSHVGAPRLRPFVRYLLEVGARQIREGEAALQSDSSDAVTLMSVHKSKGLEFPVVVVADMGRDYTRNRTDPVLFDARAGLVVRAKGDDGELLEAPLASLIQRRDKQLGADEEERLLYVAMTRARDRLILAGSPPKDKQTTTWFQAIHKVFGIGAPECGERITRHGAQLDVRRAPSDAQGPGIGLPEGAEADRDRIERRLRPIAPRQTPRGRVTVSLLAQRMAEADGPAEPPATPAPSSPPQATPPASVPAMLRGSLLHRVLEAWDCRGPVEPIVERILMRDAPAVSLRDVIAPYLCERAAAFAQTPVGRRLAAGEPATREQAFLLRLGDTLMDGAIDLLFADGTVVDYKTGRDRPELHARYARQVQLYALAVRMLTGKDVPGAFLCYIDAGEAIPIDVAPPVMQETLCKAQEAVEVLSVYVP